MFDFSNRIQIIKESKHSTLNPAVWDGMKLKSVVREALVKVTRHFMAKLFENHHELLRGGLLINDMILSGSNANYTWNPDSIWDVHVVVDSLDLKNTDRVSMIQEEFNAQQIQWNDKNTITIQEYPIQLSLDDSFQIPELIEAYSLKDNVWISLPK